MGKIIKEYETKYNTGDVVVFKKNDKLEVGLIEGYYMDCDTFWFNIRTSYKWVYTYSNAGDIGEYDIIGVLPDELARECCKKMQMRIQR